MANDPANPISCAFGPTADCPPLDELLIQMEGRQGAFARETTESHLKVCSYCTNELAMFREFESPEVRPEEQAPVRHIVNRLKRHSPVERTAWWKSIWSVKVWAPAAAALVAAGLMLTVWVPGQRNGGLDFSGGANTMRSARVQVIAPVGAILHVPGEFRWQPVAGTLSYSLSLFEIDNTELWSAVVREPRAEVPARIMGKLLAPKALNWRVTAMDAAGKTIADSGTQRFSIAR